MTSRKKDSKLSLYTRLGGIYSIAAVVDDFIDRVIDSPVLNANAAVDEAHHRVSRAGFKYLVTELVGFASGGPQKYSGRSMATAHKHLAITEAEWTELCGLFQQTLNKFQIPAVEQQELFAIVGSTKADIVRPPKLLSRSAPKSVAPPASTPSQGASKSVAPPRPSAKSGNGATNAKKTEESAKARSSPSKAPRAMSGVARED